MKLPLSLNRNITLSILLMIAVALSIWATRASLEANEQTNAHTDSKDAFMTGVKYTAFDDQGAWESGFYSPHIDHYGEKDMAFLEYPQVISRGENNLTWIITANQGASYDDGKTIILKDNVLIEKINNISQTKTSMRTIELTLYPKKKYLQTQQAVTIEQPGSVIEAMGFTADLNTGDITLTSQSKGVYTPQN